MRNQITEGFRLSPQQKRLWLLQQDSFSYQAKFALILEGNLQPEVLKSALQQVVQRHEILRTTFRRLPGMKIPVMVVADNATFSWQDLDLSDLDSKEQSDKIERIFQGEKFLCFDCEQGSLWRIYSIKQSTNKYVLILSLPALCADARTINNLVLEISHSYANKVKGVELDDEVVQYVQFSEWQNQLLTEEDAEAGKNYWHKQDFSALATLKLPWENQFQTQAEFETNSFSFAINYDIAEKLEILVQKYDTSAAVFFLACWQTLLWRLTGQADIVVGTSCDRREYEELHDTLGLFATWLPIRSRLTLDLRFTEVLELVDKALRDAEEWQDYFVLEPDDVNGKAKTFPFGFEFQEWPEKYSDTGVSFSLEKQYTCIEPFKVKLVCDRQNDSLKLSFDYDVNCFLAEAIQRLAGHFQTLLTSAFAHPDAAISKLEILSISERHQLLIEFNQTQANYPQDKCIHQLFESQAEQTPNNIAVIFEEQQLTYAELNSRANQLAHYLQQLGVKPEVLVGIYLERSLDIIIAILGILKAGGAYLPLDPALPAEGLALRLQDTQAPILLTQQHLKSQILDSRFLKSEISNWKLDVVCLDTDWGAIAQESNTNPTSEVTTENLIYVLFTSGSTGKPKGVAIEHRQLLNYLHGILERLELPNTASFATVTTFAADLGNTAIFPALCTGGCLHIISQERASDSNALAAYFQRHEIDCLKIVPSHLATLLASSHPEQILPRKLLILGGETANWDLIGKIQQIAPNCRILNHYGPTETTVGVTTFAVKNSQANPISETVPIGRPLNNTQLYVLDEQLQPVPIGVPGELYIGGNGLARGYLNQPELTTEKFIPSPFTESHEYGVLSAELKESLTQNSFLKTQNFVYKTGDLVRYLPDGNLEFLGRTDHQVKIRGFRIELGEIEALLRQHPLVQQTVVSVWEEEPGNKRLTAYVVPNRQETLSVSKLRSFLREKLPEYAIPSAFVLLKTLPLTPNGKVDRNSLPAPDSLRPELEIAYEAPRNEVERIITTIWQEMLRVEKVGINDNFFDLGGHSLLLVQVHSKLQEVLHRELSITDLFKHPTISSLASYLSKEQSEQSDLVQTQDRASNRLASRQQRRQIGQKSRTTEKQQGVHGE